jgi:hypothetical protein
VKRAPDTDGRREKLRRICLGLPEVEASTLGVSGEHLGFRVRKKTFAYYVYDHHGDGRIALLCKSAPGEKGRLVEEDPDRFFVPRTSGRRAGWACVWIVRRSTGTRSGTSWRPPGG